MISSSFIPQGVFLSQYYFLLFHIPEGFSRVVKWVIYELLVKHEISFNPNPLVELNQVIICIEDLIR